MPNAMGCTLGATDGSRLRRSGTEEFAVTLLPLQHELLLLPLADLQSACAGRLLRDFGSSSTAVEAINLSLRSLHCKREDIFCKMEKIWHDVVPCHQEGKSYFTGPMIMQNGLYT